MELTIAGELFALRTDEKITAVMIFNHGCNKGYKETRWNVNTAAEEVMVIHALGVLPEFHNCSFAKKCQKKQFVY